ncbi:hypothetical protein M0R04_13605 [Candidatus Dojkabacteria bacterium]|jgi:hypothetical protein|nr:hypothetical protein [Candidatus Dojkabacteria bacterium]
MKVSINENNIGDVEKIIQEWLNSDEQELTLTKNPTSLNVFVHDDIKAETKMA